MSTRAQPENGMPVPDLELMKSESSPASRAGANIVVCITTGGGMA